MLARNTQGIALDVEEGVIRLSGISKYFSVVAALVDVSAEFRRGEVHALLRSPATAVQGSEQAIDVGIQPATVKVALTLHDMKLHAALLYEPRLATLCQSSPDLLSLLIDREEEGGDLIDTLISDQHRAGLDAESALQRFVAGLAWTGEVPARGVMKDTAAG